jgi:hypothetical protein
MSLEGDLSQFQIADEMVVSRDEFGILKCGTIAPKMDFIVLRLTPETVDPILKQVLAAGLNHAIIHVQIERNNVLELGAYDNFHSECVATGGGVGSALLDEMKNANVLRDFWAASLGNG